MSLTAFFSPSLPVTLVMVATLIGLPWVTSLSREAAKRLGRGRREPSGFEMSLYWFSMLAEGLTGMSTLVLVPYLFVSGIFWLATDDSGSVFNQIITGFIALAAVVIVLLVAVVVPMPRKLRRIEENAMGSDDLKSNHEYKALKTLSKKLPTSRKSRICLLLSLIPISLFVAIKLCF